MFIVLRAAFGCTLACMTLGCVPQAVGDATKLRESEVGECRRLYPNAEQRPVLPRVKCVGDATVKSSRVGSAIWLPEPRPRRTGSSPNDPACRTIRRRKAHRSRICGREGPPSKRRRQQRANGQAIVSQPNSRPQRLQPKPSPLLSRCTARPSAAPPPATEIDPLFSWPSPEVGPVVWANRKSRVPAQGRLDSADFRRDNPRAASAAHHSHRNFLRCLPGDYFCNTQKKGRPAKSLILLVPLPRLERGTPRSTIWCSNQLSYSGQRQMQ